jgi:hypothetical protein
MPIIIIKARFIQVRNMMEYLKSKDKVVMFHRLTFPG